MTRTAALWVWFAVACGGAPAQPALSSTAPATTAAPASRAALGQVCDDGEHIFVVDAHAAGSAVVEERDAATPLAGTVVAITRADGKRVDGAIGPDSASLDKCSGTAGGHPGCSMSGGSTIHSSVLGTATLLFGNAHRNSIFRGDAETPCRNAEGDDPTLSACSTASWTVIAGGTFRKQYLRVFGGVGAALLFEEAAPSADERYTGKRALLDIHDGGGLVTIDGKTEPCLAVYRAPD